MKFTLLSPLVRKVGAAGIATLVLSTLAQAQASDTAVVNTVVDDTTSLFHKPIPISAVPEANAALVLIPVVAAILFFSTRRLWSARAAVDPKAQKASR